MWWPDGSRETKQGRGRGCCWLAGGLPARRVVVALYYFLLVTPPQLCLSHLFFRVVAVVGEEKNKIQKYHVQNVFFRGLTSLRTRTDRKGWHNNMLSHMSRARSRTPSRRRSDRMVACPICALKVPAKCASEHFKDCIENGGPQNENMMNMSNVSYSTPQKMSASGGLSLSPFLCTPGEKPYSGSKSDTPKDSISAILQSAKDLEIMIRMHKSAIEKLQRHQDDKDSIHPALKKIEISLRRSLKAVSSEADSKGSNSVYFLPTCF